MRKKNTFCDLHFEEKSILSIFFKKKKKIGEIHQVLFKIHILAMLQSIARSLIKGGHASMEVEVVKKTTKSGGFSEAAPQKPRSEAPKKTIKSGGFSEAAPQKPWSEAMVRSRATKADNCR